MVLSLRLWSASGKSLVQGKPCFHLGILADDVKIWTCPARADLFFEVDHVVPPIFSFGELVRSFDFLVSIRVSETPWLQKVVSSGGYAWSHKRSSLIPPANLGYLFLTVKGEARYGGLEAFVQRPLCILKSHSRGCARENEPWSKAFHQSQSNRILPSPHAE